MKDHGAIINTYAEGGLPNGPMQEPPEGGPMQEVGIKGEREAFLAQFNIEVLPNTSNDELAVVSVGTLMSIVDLARAAVDTGASRDALDTVTSDLLKALKAIASSSRDEDGCYYTNRANIGIAEAAIARASLAGTKGEGA